MTALLDTCVLIDLLRGRPVALKAMANLDERPCICPVSSMELWVGLKSQSDEAETSQMLANFRMVGLTEPTFRRAGEHMRHYHASHGLEIADALIAATAEHHGLDLATLNVKHFPMFKRLNAAY